MAAKKDKAEKENKAEKIHSPRDSAAVVLGPLTVTPQ